MKVLYKQLAQVNEGATNNKHRSMMVLYKQLAQVNEGAVQAISTGQKRVLHKYHNQLQEVKQGAVQCT